jgi:lysine-specific demethylase 3
MDMADAMNIMTYTSRTNGGGALWDIFRTQDSNAIREFLREELGHMDDPIHSQQVYIDKALAQKLWKQKRVSSYQFLQMPGDAVFIPAGCAHQVSTHCLYARIFFNVVLGLQYWELSQSCN